MVCVHVSVCVCVFVRVWCVWRSLSALCLLAVLLRIRSSHVAQSVVVTFIARRRAARREQLCCRLDRCVFMCVCVSCVCVCVCVCACVRVAPLFVFVCQLILSRILLMLCRAT